MTDVFMSSDLFQSAEQLHGFEQVLLLGLQTAAHALTHFFELAASGLNGVLSIVRVLDQLLAFMTQRRRSVQNLLNSKNRKKWRFFNNSALIIFSLWTDT